MVLTVLDDDQVRGLLENLDADELARFRQVLNTALFEFSTDVQADEDGLYQQPHRTTTCHRQSQAMTLYMPSSCPQGMGCKVVSLTAPDSVADPTVKAISPTGVMNLFAPDGTLIGLIHAKTLTAFRTALASTSLVARRKRVKVITVFGSGEQAYWHVRLCLMMRGSTIKQVNVINRSFSDKATGMLKSFAVIPLSTKEREGWSRTEFGLLTPTFHEYDRLLKKQLRSSDIIFCCTPSRTDLFDANILTSHQGRTKGRLIIAVGSYRPGMRELPEGLLLQATGNRDGHRRHFHKHAEEAGVIIVDSLDGALKEAGEIIAAKINPKQLVELGELVMLHRLAIEESESENLGTQTPGTASSGSEQLDIADQTASMSLVYGESQPKSGSVSSDASSGPRSKSSFSLPFFSSSSGSTEGPHKEDGLARWLRDGTVIYKSVGLGLMDLVVGMHLIEVAKEKRIGTLIESF